MKFSLFTKLATQTEEFRKDQFVIWSFRICVVTLILCIALLILAWQHLPPVIPLLYSLPWGEEQLTQPAALIVLLVSSCLFYAVNTVIAYALHTRISYLSHLVTTATTALILLLAYTLINLIVLVT